MLQFPKLPGQRGRTRRLASQKLLIRITRKLVAAAVVIPPPSGGVAAAEHQQAPILGLGPLVAEAQVAQARTRLHAGIHVARIVRLDVLALEMQAFDVVLCRGKGDGEP